MSAIRLGILCFAVSLLLTKAYAQFSPPPLVTVIGEVRSRSDSGPNELFVEIYDGRTNSVVQRVPVEHGQFQLDRVPEGAYTVRVVTAAGQAPIVEEYHQFGQDNASLVLELPERSAEKPISGVVSLRELQHPIPKRAKRAAYEAQEFANAKDVPRAIAKLEEAIRIDPGYRDAHSNLGVLYARAGRGVEARAELQRALDIGPPVAPIYSNLALISAAMRLFPEAESEARKALELDPRNATAKRVLERLPAH